MKVRLLATATPEQKRTMLRSKPWSRMRVGTYRDKHVIQLNIDSDYAPFLCEVQGSVCTKWRPFDLQLMEDLINESEIK